MANRSEEFADSLSNQMSSPVGDSVEAKTPPSLDVLPLEVKLMITKLFDRETELVTIGNLAQASKTFHIILEPELRAILSSLKLEGYEVANGVPLPTTSAISRSNSLFQLVRTFLRCPWLTSFVSKIHTSDDFDIIQLRDEMEQSEEDIELNEEMRADGVLFDAAKSKLRALREIDYRMTSFSPIEPESSYVALMGLLRKVKAVEAHETNIFYRNPANTLSLSKSVPVYKHLVSVSIHSASDEPEWMSLSYFSHFMRCLTLEEFSGSRVGSWEKIDPNDWPPIQQCTTRLKTLNLQDSYMKAEDFTELFRRTPALKNLRFTEYLHRKRYSEIARPAFNHALQRLRSRLKKLEIRVDPSTMGDNGTFFYGPVPGEIDLTKFRVLKSANITWHLLAVARYSTVWLDKGLPRCLGTLTLSHCSSKKQLCTFQRLLKNVHEHFPYLRELTLEIRKPSEETYAGDIRRIGNNVGMNIGVLIC